MRQGFIFRPDLGEQSDPHARIIEALTSRPPANIGEGLTALGAGLAARRRRLGDFPTAPGGNSLVGGLKNFFGLNFPTKGGLW
jgi:hypothetical protein